MEFHLKIIGILLITLALLHFSFPRYLNWKQQLAPLSLLNRQIMYVHSFFIAFTVFLIGLLCFNSADALVNTTLGKQLCLGIGIFWTVRLLVQFFGYSAKIWRGKKFETIVHLLITFLWIYLSIIFLTIYFRQ